MTAAEAGSRRFVLLDRDGVINRDLPGSVTSVDEFEMIPGSARAIAALNDSRYEVIVITNQACIGRGDLSPAELENIHGRMHDEVAAAGGRILDIFLCPHTDADRCSCRKPQPGLILDAARKYGIDLEHTWFIGDAARDVEAALAAGCRPALVRSGKASDEPSLANIDIFDDLEDFVSSLRRNEID